MRLKFNIFVGNDKIGETEDLRTAMLTAADEMLARLTKDPANGQDARIETQDKVRWSSMPFDEQPYLSISHTVWEDGKSPEDQEIIYRPGLSIPGPGTPDITGNICDPRWATFREFAATLKKEDI